MNIQDKEKLNECLKLIESTTVGAPLTWLWTWDTIKFYAFNDNDYSTNLTEDQLWEKLCEAVSTGNSFTLEYGSEHHQESVLEWLLNRDYIQEKESEDDNE